MRDRASFGFQCCEYICHVRPAAVEPILYELVYTLKLGGSSFELFVD